jgi:uncharacterized protein YbjQ (UPF0145 family)
MPFVHRSTEEGGKQEESRRRHAAEDQMEQEASLDALAQGGIPIRAQRRLDDLRHREGFFTSDLTVNEFLLARQCGLQPMTQVMGSSIYHVGWETRRLPLYGYSGEVEVVSQAMNHARQLALGRLAEEARRAGARAVVGVHVIRREYDWAKDHIEYSTVGTAVRYEGGPPSKQPRLTNLSGQDFWRLIQSGYWPAGVVGASTLYFVVANRQTQTAKSWWRGRANQELQDFTKGLNAARHIVMKALRQQAARRGAAGIVGTELEHKVEEHKDEEYFLLVTFHAIATAIVGPTKGTAVPAVSPALSLVS